MDSCAGLFLGVWSRCVDLGSLQWDPSSSPLGVDGGAFVARGLLLHPPTGLNRHIQWPAHVTCSVPPRDQYLTWRYRNVRLFSIAYASRPRLRSRLTLGGRAWPRKPSAFGGQDSHLSFRYSRQHTLFQALHHSSRYGFYAPGMLPYQSSR